MAALRTLTWDEPKVISDVLKHSYSSDYNNETITIASGAGKLGIGAVLGKVATGAATAAAKSGGNTGNGTLTVDATTPVLAGAKAGVYTVRFISEASDGGRFLVEDPDGIVIGSAAVGETFADQIKFATADGATDFAEGDGFDITVAAGSGKYVASDYDGTNGSKEAVAVLLEPVDATSADVEAIALVRGPAVLGRLGLEWDDSYDSEAKKDEAISQLAALGIITRASA